MVQSRRHLKGKERERFRTHIASTPKRRPGESDNPFRFFVLTILDSAEIVRWVSESMRPFSIVEDRGFHSLMKTGRPEYYLPSTSTISHDVKEVFMMVCTRITNMLQVSQIVTVMTYTYL